LVHFESSIFLLWSLITTQSNVSAGLNSLEFTLVMTCPGICTLTIFVPERTLACIISNGLSVLVFHTDRLAIWYSSVIRPVLENCTVVWHHGLRKHQTEAIEAIQRRDIRLIYPVTTSMPHWFALQYAELPSLSDRHDKLCSDFFCKLLNSSTAFIICCHPLMTLKSHLGLVKQPHILGP